MHIELPFVSRKEYEKLYAEHLSLLDNFDSLKHRVAKVELILAEAARRSLAKPESSVTELRKPTNTWRTRAINFTKQSLSDPSTFPQEDENVSKK